MLQLPGSCAVSLTFCDVGENGPGMQKLGVPTERPVTVEDLKRMKGCYEGRNGTADFFDLRAALLDGVDANVFPNFVPESAVLVMRDFANHVLGQETIKKIEHEVESMKRDGLVDTKVLMRGSVKNKHARHNNVIADLDQSPDYTSGKGTVVKFENYPAIESMRQVAKTWMNQQHPLVCEQNRYFDVKDCGIGWHGKPFPLPPLLPPPLVCSPLLPPTV